MLRARAARRGHHPVTAPGSRIRVLRVLVVLALALVMGLATASPRFTSSSSDYYGRVATAFGASRPPTSLQKERPASEDASSRIDLGRLVNGLAGIVGILGGLALACAIDRVSRKRPARNDLARLDLGP